jgi:hypothetical protein
VPGAETTSGGTSRVPAELREWVRRYASASPEDDPDALVAGVRRALQHTLAHPGRDREAAFSLLAADGLLTLAVERLADADDPEARLRAIAAVLAADAAPPSASAGGSSGWRSG